MHRRARVEFRRLPHRPARAPGGLQPQGGLHPQSRAQAGGLAPAGVVVMSDAQGAQPPERLSARTKYGWASGDFGFNIFWQALNLLMMPFYTDVLKLAAPLAGTVFLIASLWDGFA